MSTFSSDRVQITPTPPPDLSTYATIVYVDNEIQQLDEKPLTIKTVTSTPYNIISSDLKKIIEMSNASANSIVIPDDSTLSLPIGFQITVVQSNTGQTTIQPLNGSIQINATPGLKLRTRWSSATIVKRASNSWVAMGDLAP